MIVLLSDKKRIADEFAILVDSYGKDYAQLHSMFQIAVQLTRVTNAATLEKAYRTLCSSLVLMHRYDDEFCFASLSLYEELASLTDIQWVEPN